MEAARKSKSLVISTQRCCGRVLLGRWSLSVAVDDAVFICYCIGGYVSVHANECT